jgi:hypothetical protein
VGEAAAERGVRGAVGSQTDERQRALARLLVAAVVAGARPAPLPSLPVRPRLRVVGRVG